MNLRDTLDKLISLLDQHPDLEPKKISKSLFTGLNKVTTDIEEGIKAEKVSRPFREELIKFTEFDEASIKNSIANFSYEKLVEFCSANGLNTKAKTKEAKIKAYYAAILKRVKALKKQLA
jgi:hypothetical protein